MICKRKLYTLLCVFFITNLAFADEPGSCAPPLDTETVIQINDFHWHYTADEMAARFRNLYYGGKRLIGRARWNADAERFEVPYNGEHAITLPEVFIDSVRNHIEGALEREYINHVFYPDMGHAHLLIPHSYYESTLRHIPVSRQYEVYSLAFKHPETRFLYHTAEQLRMLDDNKRVLPDRFLGWRYYTRNLVGANNDKGGLQIHKNLYSIGNTVCEAPENYHYWSAGFYLSASKSGCFSYTHNQSTFYFDISLTDFPRPPNEGSIADMERLTELRTLWGAHECEGD